MSRGVDTAVLVRALDAAREAGDGEWTGADQLAAIGVLAAICIGESAVLETADADEIVFFLRVVDLNITSALVALYADDELRREVIALDPTFQSPFDAGHA